MFSLEKQRKRVDNIRTAEQNNKKYFRRTRIYNYMPGQATYNLGDYPAPFSIAPTEYDHKLLKEMAENGVELIQLHEEWNDAVRHLGADKFTSFDPKGLHEFVDLAHSYGLKVIPYVSTGYFHEYDPDFTEDFVRSHHYCINGMHFKYIKCDPGSPAWRNYLLPRTMAILDEYGFDGIYNDMGYDGKSMAHRAARERGMSPEEVRAMEIPYGCEIEDLLATIYSEIHRRGGVYKLHADGSHTPPVKDKVYDYLWIGEGIKMSKPGLCKEAPDYVVPCPDYGNCENDKYEHHFARCIPFMQFPLLTKGRPLMGKRIDEDIPYYAPPEGCFSEFELNRRIKEYTAAHPDGPYVYSLWSPIPDDPNNFDLWYKYLALYRPMVKENSIAFIELRECADFVTPIPDDVYASMFVNEDKYLVVSNFTGADYTFKLTEKWRDRVTDTVSDTFTVKDNAIIFLVK